MPLKSIEYHNVPMLFSGKPVFSTLEQCSRIICEFTDEEKNVNAIMCGKSKNCHNYEDWCTGTGRYKRNEFYWTNNDNRTSSGCFSEGK